MSRRALVSVSDKSGLQAFVHVLQSCGFEIISTGGTAKALTGAGLSVTPVEQYTGFPEILSGRVKTLHPRIHAGILATNEPAHQEELQRQEIPRIDLVVVNLYPFAATAARPGVTFAEVIEQIDIGGPSLLRAAAKNLECTGVVVDPADYEEIGRELREKGRLLPSTRLRLARKAFAHTAAYDAAIANWLASHQPDGTSDMFPETLTIQWKRVQPLRYGENPQQAAAFYQNSEPIDGTVAGSCCLQGKELSYNNLLDVDAAQGLLADLDGPAVCIIKHNNPCGVALAAKAVEAFVLAFAADSQSAFGGIVGCTEPVDAAFAQALSERFLEVVVAPAFSLEAREILAKKKLLRLIDLGPKRTSPEKWLLRSVSGGVLVQSPDTLPNPVSLSRSVGARKPSEREMRDLELAWRVVKHVKSNAIVLVQDGVTVGIGAGQTSRVESTAIALHKAGTRARGAVMASDAFFPFRDSVDVAAAAGVSAIVHPGGSVRDPEVMAAAKEHDLAMLVTGERHFRH